MKTIPLDIAKGMKVVDPSKKEIGTVEDFHFSENEDMPDIEPAELDRDTPAEHSLMRDLAEAFVATDLPQVLQERLLLEGYVRLAPRGLGAHRYVLPEQIASLQGNTLVLNVDREHLIKI